MSQILLDAQTTPSTPATSKILLYAKSDGKIYTKGDDGTEHSAGSGDASGPASSTDGAVALFNGTGGKTLKDSKVVVTVPAATTTLTLASGSTFVTSGAYTVTLTFTGTTGITFPVTGTLSTLAGAEEFTNKTLNASVGKGTWTASGTWTLPAITTGGAVTGSDSQLTRQMFIDCGLTYLDKGNSSTTTQTLDYTAGQHQKVTATGNHTVATSNWPPTGNLGIMLFEATNYGAYTITWPTINWVKPDGTTTTTFSTWLAAMTGRTALQSSGIDWFKLWSRDAGTTIYGSFAA